MENDQPHEVIDLNKARDRAKARKFLRSLADNPFICIVFHEGEIRVYDKDAKPEHLRKMLAAMDAEDWSDD